MNKTELIKEISSKTGLSQNQVERVLNQTTESIMSWVVKGDEVRIVNFGSFTKLKRKARMGRNPQTGESVRIPSMWKPKFRPSGKFREQTNQ